MLLAWPPRRVPVLERRAGVRDATSGPAGPSLSCRVSPGPCSAHTRPGLEGPMCPLYNQSDPACFQGPRWSASPCGRHSTGTSQHRDVAAQGQRPAVSGLWIQCGETLCGRPGAPDWAVGRAGEGCSFRRLLSIQPQAQLRPRLGECVLSYSHTLERFCCSPVPSPSTADSVLGACEVQPHSLLSCGAPPLAPLSPPHNPSTAIGDPRERGLASVGSWRAGAALSCSVTLQGPCPACGGGNCVLE